MTVDERLVIDLGDVQAIHVECQECHTTISYPPDKWNPVEGSCPGCHEDLWRDGTRDLSDAKGLASALKAILVHPQDKGTPHVRLQVRHRAIAKEST